MTNSQTAKEIMASNLKKYLERHRKTQTDLAKDLNIPEMTVSNWMKAKTYPRIDKVQLMADYFGITRAELTEEPSEFSPGGAQHDSELIQFLAHHWGVDPQPPLLWNTRIANPENYFIFKANDTMLPTIPEGAEVLIQKQDSYESGQIVAISFFEDILLCRYWEGNDGNIIIKPENPKYSPLPTYKSDPALVFIGRAIEYKVKL